MTTISKNPVSIPIEGLGEWVKTINRLGSDVYLFDDTGQCLLQAGANASDRQNQAAELARQIPAQTDRQIRRGGPDQTMAAARLKCSCAWS